MVFEVPNSHFWSSLDMMINFFENMPWKRLSKSDVVMGLKNTKMQGYRLVKTGKPQKSKVSRKTVRAKRPAQQTQPVICACCGHKNTSVEFLHKRGTYKCWACNGVTHKLPAGA